MSYSASNHYGQIFKEDKYVRRRLERCLALIEKEIEPEIRILDIGGYSGDFFEFMRLEKKPVERIEYHILDYDDSAMKIARQRGAITHKIDFNFEAIDSVVGEKEFDIIICTEVLEHLLDPKKYLSQLPGLLKEGGTVIISLPNENTIFHRIYALFGMGIDQYAFELYKHLHFPTIKQSQKFVAKYFDIDNQEYYINFGGKGSRFGLAGKFFAIVPDTIWQIIANMLPGLFARGVIFKLKRQEGSIASV